jgi:hypothetical protein
VLYINADINGMTMNNKLSTSVSDSLLQQIRAFLDSEADLVVGGNDPAQEDEPNAALVLLRSLDVETGGDFQ